MANAAPLDQDPHVQQYDAEVARLATRIDQLRNELAQAEKDLRHVQTLDMAARRAAITGEPIAPGVQQQSTAEAAPAEAVHPTAQPAQAVEPLGPTSQKVLAYLQQHRGTPFAAGDVCEVVDCSTTQAGTALEALVRAGVVERRESVMGVITYVAR